MPYMNEHSEGQAWHPNIRHSRIMREKSAMEYVSKQDADVLEFNMSIKELLQARKGHKKLLGKRLLGPSPITKILEDEPQLIFEYKRLKDNLHEYKQDLALENDQTPDLPDNIPNNWDLIIPYFPEEKRRHYWFWSSQPDKGKTTFLNRVAHDYRAQFLNKEEKYQDMPANTQAVLIDEYSHAFMRTTTLNQMCDGTYQYPRRS